MAPVARTQQVWIRAYENEEDLWESYTDGEITLEQYLRLVGLFQSGADSLFQPFSDIDELPGGQDSITTSAKMAQGPGIDRKEFGPSPSFSSGKVALRWGYTLPLQETSGEQGYAVCRWSTERWTFFVDGRTGPGVADGCRRRGLAINLPGGKTRITFGNYEPRFGLGLVVGRRDRLLGRTPDHRLSGSVWQPQYSLYNGLQFEQRFKTNTKVTVCGSRIESDSCREDIIAGELFWAGVGPGIALGLSGVWAAVSSPGGNRRYAQEGAGLSLSSVGTRYDVSAEVARSHRGANAAAIKMSGPMGNGRYGLTLWAYDPDYVLLSSGGPGHPGRHPVMTITQELDFYSRTAGEQGLLITTHTPAGSRTTLESALEIYNDRAAGTKNIEGKLGARISLPGQTILSGYLRGRDRRGRGVVENRLYYGVLGRMRMARSVATSWRCEYGTGDVQSLRLELSGIIAVNSHVQLNPRWRYVDPDLSKPRDGYYYCYLTEGVAVAKDCRLELVAVLRQNEDATKDRYADVRIRMSWRP